MESVLGRCVDDDGSKSSILVVIVVVIDKRPPRAVLRHPGIACAIDGKCSSFVVFRPPLSADLACLWLALNSCSLVSPLL